MALHFHLLGKNPKCQACRHIDIQRRADADRNLRERKHQVKLRERGEADDRNHHGNTPNSLLFKAFRWWLILTFVLLGVGLSLSLVGWAINAVYGSPGMGWLFVLAVAIVILVLFRARFLAAARAFMGKQ